MAWLCLPMTGLLLSQGQFLQCSGLNVLPVVPLTSPTKGNTIWDRRRCSCTRLWATDANEDPSTHQRTLPILQNQEKTQELQQQDDKQRSPRLSVTSALVLLLAIITLPIIMNNSPVWAIDLPAVDIYHLKIPNPLPDADPRYFISGGICAAASHGITTPLDVVKTKIQSGDVVRVAGVTENNNNNNNKSLNLIQAATSIVQQEGFPILFTGLVPTVVGYGFEGALKFGLYESLKPTFVQWLGIVGANDDSTTTTAYLFASVAAGAVASIVLCPMEQTRIRQVTDPEFAEEGFVSGVVRLTNEEGVGAIFFGLPAMLSKQVPYTMAKQVSFDLFAAFLYGVALQYSMVAANVRTEVEFFAAFLASILACLASHPGDVVLTATYKGGPSQNVGGFGGVISTLYEQNGLDAFFSGITARFFHVGAIITSQLILYDIIKQMLGLPATGTH